MAEEQELTPEEKLLKVIQKGEEPQEEAASEPTPAAEPEAVSEETPTETPAAPAEAAEPATETSTPPSPAAAPEAASEGSASTFSYEPGASTVVSGPSATLRLINRILSLAAILLLCASGYEIYANIREPMPLIGQVAMDGSEVVVESLENVPLNDTLDMYAKRRIFGKPDAKAVVTTTTTTTVIQAGWRAYIRKNYVLKGLSTISRQSIDGETEDIREAIVVDKKTGKMQFLSAGQTVLVEKETVRISKVDGNQVVLSVGDDEITLE